MYNCYRVSVKIVIISQGCCWCWAVTTDC